MFGVIYAYCLEQRDGVRLQEKDLQKNKTFLKNLSMYLL